MTMENTVETVNPEQEKVDFTSLDVMARISDSKIETREIVKNWLLLCFDIPVTPEGIKMRNEFYKETARLGAVQCTESNYLCPWTSEVEAMALKLADVSNSRVIVWSAQTSESQAEEITKRYDAGLKPRIKEIEERIEHLNYLIEHKQYGRAKNYTEVTERLLIEMEHAVVNRGSAILLIHLENLKVRFNMAFARI
jgi:hypothetical protein